MLIAAASARRSILPNFETIGYQPDEASWRSIKMGMKRDLRVRRPGPNVPIPSWRNPVRYLEATFRETEPVYDSFTSFLHDGVWTSSGGSYRLAEKFGFGLVRAASLVDPSLDPVLAKAGIAVIANLHGIERTPAITSCVNGIILKLGFDLCAHFGSKCPPSERALASKRAFYAWTDELRAREDSERG